MRGRESGVYEWTLDILARELVLNAADYATNSLRSWRAFDTALNKIRDLEENIGAAYPELHKTNILIELRRKDSVDWIVSDIECKTKKLRFGAKIGLASTEILNEDLEKMAGFIVQIYKTLTDALNGRYPHWARRGKPVYPLITTLEAWYAFGDRILPALDEIVGRKLADENIDPAILRDHPYTICAAEDFELAIQVIQQTGIHVFMDKKLRENTVFGKCIRFLALRSGTNAQKSGGNLFPEDWRRIHPALGNPD